MIESPMFIQEALEELLLQETGWFSGRKKKPQLTGSAVIVFCYFLIKCSEVQSFFP